MAVSEVWIITNYPVFRAALQMPLSGSFSMPDHPSIFYTFEFDYDHDWRLVSTTLNINNEPEHNVLNYLEYFETSLPGTKHLHGDSQNSMYSWQHSYNPRGWLTSMNSNTPAQLFNLELFYDELPGEAGSYASSQYNGNISAMHWSTQGIEGKMGAYAFEYDNLNRLTDATYYYKDASNNLHYCLSGGSNPVDSKRAIIGIGSVFDIGYDKNGNIDSLTRIGRQQSGWLTFDKLTYTYDTSYFPNRLKAVDDKISGQNNLGDFHDNGYKYHQLGQAEYLYDPNGNMTSDINRSLSLEYALGINLPERIIHPGGHIRNYYTPAGRKTGKKIFDASNNLLSQELYYGDLIIKDGRATRILHANGVVNLSGGPPEFDYHLKDHLGNVRLVIKPDASNNPLVLQANDYYPFGMSYSTAPGVNKYLYNSKEEQEMPGKFLDYGWRMYDAQLGRWHGVDPHAENYLSVSSYAYVGNNPIIRIDPDGRDWYIANREGATDKPLWLPGDTDANDVYGEGSFINLGSKLAQEVVVTGNGDVSFGESYEEPDITGKVLAPQTIVSDISYFNMTQGGEGYSLTLNIKKGDQVWLDLNYVDKGSVPRVETTIFDTEGLGGSAFRQISRSDISYSKPGFLRKLFGVANSAMDLVDTSKTVTVNGVQVYKSSTRYEGETLKPYIE